MVILCEIHTAIFKAHYTHTIVFSYSDRVVKSFARFGGSTNTAPKWSFNVVKVCDLLFSRVFHGFKIDTN